jgi:hypothetical protein
LKKLSKESLDRSLVYRYVKGELKAVRKSLTPPESKLLW